MFCRLSGGDTVNVNPLPKTKIEAVGEIIEFGRDSKLYTAKDVWATDYNEICNLDINLLTTQNFYKFNIFTNSSEKINNFQIQDGKVVVNTQQIATQTNEQLHNSTNSISSSESNENEEVIINEEPGDNSTKKLTNELIKQMKKEVEKLQKQCKQQQKAEQKTGAYTQIQEAEETEAMKLLKLIYNTNYKDPQRGMGKLSYNDEESIKNNQYVFEITNEESETEKIYFNKKSKMKELEDLIKACDDLIAKQILNTDERGLIL